MLEFDVAIVGGGILGLAHAWVAARRGYSVVLFERSARAQGASVRNFGMIWPIGQPPGPTLQLALRSRDLWREVLNDARLPFLPTGSLHLAYRDDEIAVVQEFAERGPALGYQCRWLSAEETLKKSSAANPDGLQGALWSETELTVDPRLISIELTAFLEERFGVVTRFSEPVRAISDGIIETPKALVKAENVIVCGGHDFETLFPHTFECEPIRKCKLQMMRTAPQPDGWQLGPALAAGLTLRFYSSFRVCESLATLERRIEEETPEYNRWGIHVMASQTALGEITIGDSHEYDLSLDLFDKPEIDELILNYLATFARIPNMTIAQRWHGIYSKHPDRHYFSVSPQSNVQIVTATGGAGMTLSFGIAEKTIAEIGL